MKVLFFLFPLSCLLFIFSCKKDVCEDIPPSENTIIVMPLGDSRVEGARSEFESYRYELWKNLENNNWDVNFMGSRQDNADYPQLNNQCFDNEHESTGGATTADIINTLNELEFDFIPDVVTLGIGGNDLLGKIPPTDAISNLNEIIDLLQAKNPNVIILLEQIAPGLSGFMTTEMTTDFNQYNGLIPDVANNQSDSLSKVYVVDMRSNWSDNYMADDVHYNEAGAKVVADRYYQAFVDYIPR